jgi:hypothetical protein
MSRRNGGDFTDVEVERLLCDDECYIMEKTQCKVLEDFPE